jgi:hypothetical protein
VLRLGRVVDRIFRPQLAFHRVFPQCSRASFCSTIGCTKSAAIHEGIVESICEERLREILHEEAVSSQAVKTWKKSNDPKFDSKVRQLRTPTNREHNPPIVVAADERGPLSLKPYGGHTWARSGHPDRTRATYKKTFGTRYLFGMYDCYRDQKGGFLSPSEHTRVWRRFLRFVRAHYPRGGRIYLINDQPLDPLDRVRAAHRPSARYHDRGHPPSASEHNPIEAHFGELKDLGLTASDYPSWRHMARAIHDAIDYRNRNSIPKVHNVKRRLWVRHSAGTTPSGRSRRSKEGRVRFISQSSS